MVLCSLVWWIKGFHNFYTFPAYVSSLVNILQKTCTYSPWEIWTSSDVWVALTELCMTLALGLVAAGGRSTKRWLWILHLGEAGATWWTPSSPLCICVLYWKSEKKKKVIIKVLSASFCLLLFSQQGNASKGRWVAARWQTRCCVYYRETGRAFDWGPWIISGISESVIFPFFLWNWVMKRSPEYFPVSIHSWLCLVPVILTWAETSFYFVAVLHWIPLVLKREEGDAHSVLWKCLFVVLLVAQTKVALAHSGAKSVGPEGTCMILSPS